MPLTGWYSSAVRPVTAAEFAALMVPLGPFEPAPHLAVAVSGGADSMALAILAAGWATARGGSVTALVVDHRLRPESGAEAAVTAERLRQRGIAARLLTLVDLARGPGLAERARAARYAALDDACAAAGILHLLLGHHAADQAETVAIRMLDHSGLIGLAGMAALAETAAVRRLRPLLAVPPGRLRATVHAAGLAWVKDPSNADPSAQRVRIRKLRADEAGEGVATRASIEAAAWRGEQRQAAERAIAAELAARASIHPEGFGTLSAGPISPSALAALLRVIAGARYSPPPAKVERLATEPGPATIAGVRIMPAPERLTPDPWLLVREASAMARPVPAHPGAVWDGRFRIAVDADLPQNATLGALGPDAAPLRRLSLLPASVLRTLPALRSEGNLFAVPHLQYCANGERPLPAVVNCAPVPAAGAPFAPSAAGLFW